ncbi:hypothetical protein CO046_00055 [Candidatus Peregrinibacteria bacterium CG_4_9_14_0_2_um_filter_53_11]|nr:MAG: hypothetical protein CO046_00055 [Candidatus Peregrinibacteria bacterium CG_4_9_14_0_2_um_filter_53_11]
MSLKQIPTENLADCVISTSLKNEPQPKTGTARSTKNFNPGNTIKKTTGKEGKSLKELCLKLARYINRGSSASTDEIDTVITGMHRGILKLQKEKNEKLRERARKRNKK